MFRFQRKQISSDFGHQQSGFVLPFVLLTIAAVSLVATSTYLSLSQSTSLLIRLQDRTALEIAVMSAEAETLFAYTTGTAGENGLQLPVPGVATPTAADMLTGGSGVAFDPTMIWAPDGAIRQSATHSLPILVGYRDASGLAPINRLEEDKLAALMTLAGFDGEDALKVAAELADFIDTDVIRRIRGAERSDYRLFQKTPPPDSPLRRLAEIQGLLSLPDQLGDAFWQALIAMTTLSPNSSSMSAAFAPAPLIGPVVEDDEFGMGFGSTTMRPTNRARFFFLAPSMAKGKGGFVRIIEIEKVVNAAPDPVRRTLVTEGYFEPDEILIGLSLPRLLEMVAEQDIRSDPRQRRGSNASPIGETAPGAYDKLDLPPIYSDRREND